MTRSSAVTVGVLAQIRSADKKVRLAERLIENWTEPDFDFASYKDTYLEKMRSLIDAKIEGREMVVPEVEEEPSVINLMDALKKSVGRQSAGAGRERSRRDKRRPAAPRPAKSRRTKRRRAS